MMSFSQFLAEKYGTTGTYAALTFEKSSIDKIAAYVKSNNIPNPLDTSKLHVTLLQSRTEAVGYTARGPMVVPYLVGIKHFNVWKNGNSEGYALVAELDAPEVVARHKELMKKYGTPYDFPEYRPHFTLSYDVGKDFSVESLPSFDGELVLNNEYSETLNPKWNTTD